MLSGLGFQGLGLRVKGLGLKGRGLWNGVVMEFGALFSSYRFLPLVSWFLACDGGGGAGRGASAGGACWLGCVDDDRRYAGAMEASASVLSVHFRTLYFSF
jgi:hypothetical protein